MTLYDELNNAAEEVRLERKKAKEVASAKEEGAQEAKDAEKRHEEAQKRGMI